MTGWVENLRSFDSHERGILLQWVAGRDFHLSNDIRDQIRSHIDRQVPAEAFVAMDYTLDWLYAALRTTLAGAPIASPQPWPPGGELAASPEDVDLLVAWEDAEGPHTVLVEAKGYTGWSNAQMASKAARLAAIFPANLAERFDVHFMLAGPKESKNLSTTGWPSWMKRSERVHFLNITDPGTRFSVQRCDEQGHPTKTGFTHWQPKPRTWPPPS